MQKLAINYFYRAICLFSAQGIDSNAIWKAKLITNQISMPYVSCNAIASE